MSWQEVAVIGISVVGGAILLSLVAFIVLVLLIDRD